MTRRALFGGDKRHVCSSRWSQKRWAVQSMLHSCVGMPARCTARRWTLRVAGKRMEPLHDPGLSALHGAGGADAPHLVLLKVVGHHGMGAQRDLARDGLLPPHDQPQQGALAAPVRACTNGGLGLNFQVPDRLWDAWEGAWASKWTWMFEGGETPGLRQTAL